MRSGWPHTQEDPGSLASRQQAQYGPVDSWPNGYPALGNGEGDYPYPAYGSDPYASEAPVMPAVTAPPASPDGEHPYAAFGEARQGSGGHTVPNFEAFGYGDPGYSSPGYDGPASRDAGTHTGRGGVDSSTPHSAQDIYHQPWDYNQPLRYDDEEASWPLPETPGQTRRQPAAFDPAGYNGSDVSMPGISAPGYDISGIIGTSDFPNIGYDQPSYGRLSYDDPRYADFSAQDVPRGGTRYDMPVLEEPPSENTRYDMPALEDFEDPRLDHVWPAREDLSGFSADRMSQTSLDLGAEKPRMSQTQFDMPAVDDYQYGDRQYGDRQYDIRPDRERFTQTSADGMPALPAEPEFRPVGMSARGSGPGLVAPADEQPMNWADETSFDRFGDAHDRDAAPPAFTPAPSPLRDTGARRAANGKRRGNSRDKREWMALGAIAVVAAGAIGGVLMKFVFSGQSGPTHSISTPAKVADFTREPSLEKQMKVSQLRDSVIQSSGGKASDVVSGVYQQGSSAVGSNPQIYMFVGGNLANSDPQASVSNFEQTYKQGGAHVVPAGSSGGQAACATSSVNGESVSMCVWFDNDTFGEFVSPTMTPAKLASTMTLARQNLEHVAH